jgi:hypothetical protein
VRRRETITRTILFSDPPPAAKTLMRLVKVDVITWERVPLGDGSVAWRGDCPCGQRIATGFERVKPAVLVCPACKKWRRLP